MTNFNAPEVRRAIRTLDAAASDILTAGYSVYKARIVRFISIINEDKVINSIVAPLLAIPVDFEFIHFSRNGHWISELKLPSNVDEQLAYVVQIFDQVVKGDINLDSLSHRIYKHKRFEDNIQQFLSEIARPCLRELIDRLHDLVEVEVKGKESIASAALQIFNYGSITAEQGSAVAIGKDIQQTVNYENITHKIMDLVREQQVVPEEKMAEVEQVMNEIQEEINKPEPSQSKLKDFAGKVYGLGETALLKVVSTVLTDPKWGQAVSETLLATF
ncbi:hypothetical protein JFV29_14065 [Peribacillus sp. TH16]|uniref:hypothetical protein n=1 Tax=Peribacillus sp. TH16 TaxID=2798482 RepID=UPI0019116062|nr:hypothetical protein [Peribacillus sp. TH16]MBK5482972.1 hypothetical protein [Peribacillus sp. TH16]MBK5482996.1 hypothetical protein [Peribacillus sp. TH16]